jgi:hypothetical protein
VSQARSVAASREAFNGIAAIFPGVIAVAVSAAKPLVAKKKGKLKQNNNAAVRLRKESEVRLIVFIVI